MSERFEAVEWRVVTDQTEDDFGTDEAGARDWAAHCDQHPDWRPAVLESRVVTTETTDWGPTA